MKLTEDMIEKLLSELKLENKLPYGEETIDYTTPFAKISWRDSIINIGGVDEAILDDTKAMEAFLNKKGIEVAQGLSKGKLQAELFDEFVEEKLINPTFITHYPADISPLARRNDENPDLTDRFEFFVAGKEIANGYNELNDPVDQYERFQDQLKAKEAGDDEANDMDEDYVNALGYGMSPTAGEGIGIDRLVMLLTNQHSIRDVILFPAMKPIIKKENEEE